MTEILLLEIRNLIADKEWATACANMETARAGEWTRDWYEQVRRDEPELQRLIAAAETERGGTANPESTTRKTMAARVPMPTTADYRSVTNESEIHHPNRSG